jgi:hypothetical protein
MAVDFASIESMEAEELLLIDKIDEGAALTAVIEPTVKAEVTIVAITDGRK